MTDMTTPEPADSEEIPRELRQALAKPAVWAEPPSHLQDDALAALREARSAAAETPTTPDRTGTGRLAGWLIAAAAAVLIVAGLTWMLRTDAPDSTLALRGTDLAPSASAEVEITQEPSGFEVVLDVEGLAPAAKGTYYQAWFKDSDGVLVTIGTFHARQSGEDIVLWSGVDPDDFDVLTVTLQKVGGGAESSGQVVLSGSLREVSR